jgi:hypothetical protein
LIVGREDVVKHADVALASALLEVPADEHLVVFNRHTGSFAEWQ